MKDIVERAHAIFIVVPREPGDSRPRPRPSECRPTNNLPPGRYYYKVLKYYIVCSYHIVRYRIVQYRARPVCITCSVSSFPLLLPFVMTDTGHATVACLTPTRKLWAFAHGDEQTPQTTPATIIITGTTTRTDKACRDTVYDLFARERYQWHSLRKELTKLYVILKYLTLNFGLGKWRWWLVKS